MEQACTPNSGSTFASHKCLYIKKSGAAETRQQSTLQLYLMAAALIGLSAKGGPARWGSFRSCNEVCDLYRVLLPGQRLEAGNDEGAQS